MHWSDMLAQERYGDALDMFLNAQGFSKHLWTATKLRDMLSNYGCERKTCDSGEHRKASSFLQRDGLQEYRQKFIDVVRKKMSIKGADLYAGFVLYREVSLDGERSDLSAEFNIRKLPGNVMTLEFNDIHVM